ncbi:MAG: hypothetical protein K1X74_12640 [Pirellulales bacterium]|nr:hypothetical protein [Pirellulales bacterium]
MAVLLVAVASAGPGQVAACPFCNAVQPTLAQRREAAVAVAVGEVLTATGDQQRFRLHALVKGRERWETPPDELTLAADVPRKPGQLAILFGTAAGEEIAWKAVDAEETLLSYFYRAPSLREPGAQRLRYFARYLEHPQPAIAEDAYLEFGHAPYDVVAQASDGLASARLQAWLLDERVPQHRKGFYGVALGLPRPERERQANLEFLRRLVSEPSDDFRAGFDGILGGFLLAGGEGALDTLDQRLLAVPDAPEGDLRHAVKTLRFVYEFGKDIPPERVARSMRQFLKRPGFAAAAIVDLARWQDWDCLEQVAALYDRAPSTPAGTRRAVIGYLANCPRAEAAVELAALKQRDPQGVAAVLDELDRLGGFEGSAAP